MSTITKMMKDDSVIGLEELAIRSNPKAGDEEVIDRESFCLAKHVRTPVPSSERQRATKVGDVDICGPVGAETYSGSRYFILFKDEYSNFRFVYCMKSRDESHDISRECIAKVISVLDHKVRRV